jgi:pimeloyl-ACP methyl ester carboxylesterase
MKKYVHFKGKKIFYNDEGTGRPVVLIHGYLETGDIWSSFEKKLSKKYRIINVDLPGHGLSDIYSDTHTMEFLAESINGLLNTIGISKAFLVGHSLGGYITLAFLDMFPDKLSGYCLFHSHPFPDTPEIVQKRDHEILVVSSGKKYLIYPENIRRTFADRNLVKFSRAMEHSKTIASGISAEGIIAVLRGMKARPSRQSVMEEGQIPCLWILGSMDNYIPCQQTQHRVALPANAEIVVLKETGHMGFIEEEDLSFKVLTGFIDKLPYPGF